MSYSGKNRNDRGQKRACLPSIEEKRFSNRISDSKILKNYGLNIPTLVGGWYSFSIPDLIYFVQYYEQYL